CSDCGTVVAASYSLPAHSPNRAVQSRDHRRPRARSARRNTDTCGARTGSGSHDHTWTRELKRASFQRACSFRECWLDTASSSDQMRAELSSPRRLAGMPGWLDGSDCYYIVSKCFGEVSVGRS